MRKPYLLPLYIIVFLLPLTLSAINPGQTRWCNEQADTTRITTLLSDASSKGFRTPNEILSYIAPKFEGTPYVAATLEGPTEMLTINLDGMDCTTFMETVAALALTVNEGRNSWQDFVYNLENLRYRQGKLDGYASRLHYVSDWIVDNAHRGNIREVTDRLQGVGHSVKTLDFMSTHRDSYPALADSMEFERIKSVEVGYRSHRYPYIKNASLMGKNAGSFLQSGDIIAFTTKTDGLDVSHVGIIMIDNGIPHLLHASSAAGKVINDPLPLAEYLRKNRNITGGRIIRLAAR